jgi:hypothetical protein
MNYLDRLAVEIQREVDQTTTPSDADLPIYRQYAVLLLAKGSAVSTEDVHNAWVAWASTYNPESQHLIPFNDLPPSVQQRDEPFAAAIRAVAANQDRG